MVSKLKKTNNNKTKQKKDPYSMVRGAEKIITKFGTENLYTNLQSERCDCAIKKKGFRHFFPTTEDTVPTVSCFKFSFLLFVKWLIDAFLEMKLCILLFMRSTQYTEWNPGFQRGKKINNKKICLLKPPCKNGSFIYKSLTLRKNICTMY